MSSFDAIAVYIVQALVWVGLARHAARDLPRSAKRGGPTQSLGDWLAQYDSAVWQSFSWTMLGLSTVALLVWLLSR
jgi:hypothetical protein